MAQFTEEQLNEIWEKGLKVEKYNPDFVRKDACGAWMIRGRYKDRSSQFGWEVDHIYPEAKLKDIDVPQEKIDDICNLRPLNWHNNESKGSDYPHYRAKTKAGIITDKETGQINDVNVICEDEKEINDEIQSQIKELFKDYCL